MKRNTKSKELFMELTVGTFVFIALLSLGFFTILLSGEALFRSRYPIEVVFDDVMGLREGDNVVMRGMPIGKVKALELKEDGVLVSSSLRTPVKLREDYSIEIIMSSVLGGRYMQIHEGSDAMKELDPAQEVRGNAPIDLVVETGALIADFKEIADKINRGEGTLGKLVNDDALYADAREVMGEIRTAVHDRGLLENLEESALNMSEISGKINRGEGTLGKLLNDDALYADAREVVGQIRTAVHDGGLLENLEEAALNVSEISGKINRGEGTLGKLVNEDDIYEEGVRVLRDARTTLNDLRETAPIVTFTSIFFGVF